MTNMAAGWFYSVDDGRKGPFSPEQMSALLAAGVVTEHTKVWSEAVAEWTPLFRTELRALLGDRVIAPPEIAAPAATPPAQPIQQQQAQPLYENRTLATVLEFASYGFALGCAVVVFLSWRSKTLQEQVTLIDTVFVNGPWAIGVGVALIAIVILFLTWKYRTTANLIRIAGPQSVTAAGAVYWYFVPLLWFWKPYEAMRNIARGFGSEDKLRDDVIWWWLTWWLSAACAVALMIFVPEREQIRQLDDFRTYVWLNIISCVLDAVCFSRAAALIRGISGMERARMAALRAA